MTGHNGPHHTFHPAEKANLNYPVSLAATTCLNGF